MRLRSIGGSETARADALPRARSSRRVILALTAAALLLSFAGDAVAQPAFWLYSKFTTYIKVDKLSAATGGLVSTISVPYSGDGGQLEIGRAHV